MTVWTLVDVGGLLVPRGAGEDELNHWDFEGRGFESLTLHHLNINHFGRSSPEWWHLVAF